MTRVWCTVNMIYTMHRWDSLPPGKMVIQSCVFQTGDEKIWSSKPGNMEYKTKPSFLYVGKLYWVSNSEELLRERKQRGRSRGRGSHSPTLAGGQSSRVRASEGSGIRGVRSQWRHPMSPREFYVGNWIWKPQLVSTFLNRIVSVGLVRLGRAPGTPTPRREEKQEGSFLISTTSRTGSAATARGEEQHKQRKRILKYTDEHISSTKDRH